MSIDIKNDSPQTEPVDWEKRRLLKIVLMAAALKVATPFATVANAASYIPQAPDYKGYKELKGIVKPEHLDEFLEESTKAVLRIEEDYIGRSEVIYQDNWLLRSREPWKTRLWWPIFDGPADKQEIPKLDAEFWPAWLYDPLGGVGDVWGQAREKAKTIRERNPNSVSYAGYCPWVSAAQLLDEKPIALFGENLAGEENPERIVQLKEGLLTLKRSGAIMVPLKLIPEALTASVARGLAVSVNAPVNLGVGDWYRAVVGVRDDGQMIRVTDFGKSNKDIPLSAIESAWSVFPADSPFDFYKNPEKNIDIRLSSSFWRYNIDRNFIDGLVYPY